VEKKRVKTGYGAEGINKGRKKKKGERRAIAWTSFLGGLDARKICEKWERSKGEKNRLRTPTLGVKKKNLRTIQKGRTTRGHPWFPGKR